MKKEFQDGLCKKRIDDPTESVSITFRLDDRQGRSPLNVGLEGIRISPSARYFEGFANLIRWKHIVRVCSLTLGVLASASWLLDMIMKGWKSRSMIVWMLADVLWRASCRATKWTSSVTHFSTSGRGKDSHKHQRRSSGLSLESPIVKFCWKSTSGHRSLHTFSMCLACVSCVRYVPKKKTNESVQVKHCSGSLQRRGLSSYVQQSLLPYDKLLWKSQRSVTMQD